MKQKKKKELTQPNSKLTPPPHPDFTLQHVATKKERKKKT